MKLILMSCIAAVAMADQSIKLDRAEDYMKATFMLWPMIIGVCVGSFLVVVGFTFFYLAEGLEVCLKPQREKILREEKSKAALNQEMATTRRVPETGTAGGSAATREIVVGGKKRTVRNSSRQKYEAETE